ncbi:MAG: 4Fe-4S binding protein [Methanobacterium sp.]
MKNDKCGCEDTKTDKIVEDNLKEDNGCGCGDENPKAPEEDAGCGCGAGAIDYPDLSHFENPDKPKVIVDDEFIKEFEDYAYSLGIKSIGYTLLTPDLLIQDKFIQYPNAIVLTMEMDEKIVNTAPGEEAKDLNDTAYVKLGILTTKISDYLRENGYATEIAHPYGGLVNFSPLAQCAGLGYIGESGLLITPELGPRVKISAIFTSIANLPIKKVNEHAWIPDYCEKCGKCIKACPEKALIEKETCCSTETEFIRKQCIGCSQGCTYCIEDCPFNKKGYEHVKNKFDKMNAKLKEKKDKKFKTELWDKWARENASLSSGLVDGAIIALSMPQDEGKMVLLEKENRDFNVSIKNLKELERSGADLVFIMDEKSMREILNDTTSAKFIGLLSSGKIRVYTLKSQLQLIDKGYMAFLSRFGIRLGGGCCS